MKCTVQDPDVLVGGDRNDGVACKSRAANDIAVSADGKFVYTINSQSGNIGIFAINQNDGTLTNLGQAGDLPKSVGFNGIAAL